MAKAPEAPEATKTYKALTHVHHDGKLCRKGGTLELTDKHAKPLLEIKSIAPIAEDKAAE